MNAFVFFAFDVVAWVSAWLKSVLSVVAGEDTDLAAAILVAGCCLVVLACRDFAVRRAPLGRCLAKAIGPAFLLYLSVGLITWAGDKRVRLAPEKIKQDEGRSNRFTFTSEQQRRLPLTKGRLVCIDGTAILQRVYLSDGRYHRASSVARVVADEGGSYVLKGRILHFSPHDDVLPATGRTYVFGVEPGWVRFARVGLCWLFVLGGLFLAERALVPALVRSIGGFLREPWFLVPAFCFVLFFGAHQWRFIHQDARMQMVTSRDDDGYMMARLVQSAELGTMDPWRVSNNAYGAIGYYPFAVLPYVASQLGVRPSIEALNVNTRGIKLLMSLALLAAVWRLGARNLGRTPAFAAVVLTALNMGFLSYSSFPFYPDVFMAFFATLSLHHMLELARGWSMREFMLALLFAALSVSVKFLTFLLFPFIFLVAVLALWRARREKPRVIIADGVPAFLAGGVMCGAVFFLCNPYPDYNIEWITPNYKMCGSLYSAEAPNIVSGTRANLAAWASSAYAYGPDRFDWYAAALAIFAALVMIGILVCAKSETTRRTAKGAAWLLAFVLAFQGYLLRSITLAPAIDHRMLMPVYALIYLVAAWGVVQVAAGISAALKSNAVRPLVWVPVCAAALWALKPRLDNVLLFWRSFGTPPAVSAVSGWLRDASIPDDAKIDTGLQTWFPPRYKKVTDGLWDPTWLDNTFHTLSGPPDVYIEDHIYYDSYFSDAVAARGMNTETQKKLHEAGHAFYEKLRHNQMLPYILALRGEEVAATNALSPLSTGFSVYVDPFAFSTNLASVATSGKDDGALTWSVPVTAGIIHVTLHHKDSAPLYLRLPGSAGNEAPELVPPLGERTGESTERRLQFSPARDITSVEFVQADGSRYSAAAIKKVRVHPPAPVGLNATRYYFTAGTDYDALLSWRPQDHAGVRMGAGEQKSITLASRLASDVAGVTLVVDSAPPGSCVAQCNFAAADKPPFEIEGKEVRQTGPDCTSFRFDLPARSQVSGITMSVRAAGDITLRQIVVDASERRAEAKQK